MAIDIDAPQSGSGILLILGLIALIIIYLFATSLGTVLLGAVVLFIIGYLILVVGGRLNDWLRHGKPLLRGRTRKKDREARSGGGDSDGD